MERNGQLDAVGRATIRHALSSTLLIVLLAPVLLWGVPPLSKPGAGPHNDAAQVPTANQPTAERSPADTEYARGMALAEAGELAGARQAFLRGHKLSPKDARFATELGGIEFKQKKYRQAIQWLRRARKLAPDDTYVRDFLGTLYFLDGRQEAAIEQWSRVGKPVIEDIRLQPGLKVDPVLLDRSFAFSRAETLKLSALWTTEARLQALGIYPLFSLRLAARPDGKFDVNFVAQERNGFGGKWDALLGTFRGIFYQTVTPEYYNAGGTGTNILSLWRWDPEKRRIDATVSGPLRRNPRRRYLVDMDLRNENWDVRNFSKIPGARLGFLNMRRSAGGAGITSVNTGRFTWTLAGEISHRDFRCGQATVPTACVLGGDASAAVLLTESYQLKQRASVGYDVLRSPGKQYRLAARAQSELARVWAGGSVFEKLQGELAQTWTLTDATDGPELTTTIRAGKTFGNSPFDELFMLGVERDNPLMLRAHIGTNSAGRKGNAPLGRNYFLANNDIDRKVWGNGLLAVRLGPFIDVGKISDPLSYLGTNKWLWDAGGELKVTVLGLQVRATYGRDLRAGRGAFYTWVGK